MKRVPGKTKYQIATEVDADLEQWVRETAARLGKGKAEWLRDLIVRERLNGERKLRPG